MIYTKQDAERSFDLLLKILGKEKAESYNDVGKYNLDYNSTYGGVLIEEIISSTGAVRHPFGAYRKSIREFCDCVSFLAYTKQV